MKRGDPARMWGSLMQLKISSIVQIYPQSQRLMPMHACEDFLEVVSVAHILAACMEVLGMQSLDDEPDLNIVPSDLKMKRKEE